MPFFKPEGILIDPVVHDIALPSQQTLKKVLWGSDISAMAKSPTSSRSLFLDSSAKRLHQHQDL
jgi:hypothetical protein